MGQQAAQEVQRLQGFRHHVIGDEVGHKAQVSARMCDLDREVARDEGSQLPSCDRADPRPGGFIGAIGLIVAYGLFGSFLILASGQVRERFARLLVGGVGLYFLAHFFIHVGVNVGLLPMTGLPLPLISTGVVLLLLLVLPKLSPRGFRLDSAGRAYGIVVTMVMAFMLGILVLSYEQTLGRLVAFEQWVAGGIGLLLLVLGNYLGKFPKNFWVGIRTPWTLSSDEVWFKTHRFAGRTFMAGGLLIIITAIAGLNLNYIVGTILVAALSPVLYSLIIYKRLHGFNSPRNE